MSKRHLRPKPIKDVRHKITNPVKNKPYKNPHKKYKAKQQSKINATNTQNQPEINKNKVNQKTKQQQIHTCITPTICPQAKKLQRSQKIKIAGELCTVARAQVYGD
jgi:hypothetical protein